MLSHTVYLPNLTYFSLKVLSSEMDLAKSGLIRKALTKGRSAEISPALPSSESPLKFKAPPCF
jgi:hypothetical protein